jgi:hypothetical protein
MKNKSKWKKFKDVIMLGDQEMTVIKYRCLNGCGMLTTKEPDRTKACPGCDVNNSRRREAEEASSARARADFQNEKVEISKKLTLKEELLIILPAQ